MFTRFLGSCRLPTCRVAALVVLAVVGCSDSGNNATNSATFRPSRNEVGFEVHNINPKDVGRIREALKSIPGIDKESIRIYPEGNLIVFTAVDSKSRTMAGKKVLEVLPEFGLEPPDGFSINID